MPHCASQKICATITSMNRQYYIDWLRVVAVLLLVPFHTAMIFVYWDFHIKNPELSQGLTVFNAFLGVWHMPLLFLLSGAGTWFALGHRDGKAYVRERFLRLFVPLLFGILFIIPPQVYCERLKDGVFEGSYFAFYKHAFIGVYPDGNLSYHHLWFMAYLFVFSMLALPIVTRFRKEQAKQSLEKLAAFLEPSGRILLAALPLLLIQTTLRVRWPGFQNLVDDWANFTFYITVFLYGYFLCAHERIAEAVVRQRKLCLTLALVCMALYLGLHITDRVPRWGYTPANLSYLALRGFAAWCWILTWIGYAKRHLNFTNGFLRYASEAALPFYILHQTFIVILGYFVVQWDWAITSKFTFIVFATLVLTTLTYEVVVRRVPPMRFCFGMKKPR